MQINATLIEVVHASVTDQDVDAIVNAANTAMRGGGGIDGRIHAAAGPGLLQELRKVSPQGTPTGSAIITRGHSLKQPYIIHTPGPVWTGGNSGERGLLADCYGNCMRLAQDQKLKSIAFCSISTGVYGFPIDQAAPLAIDAVVRFLRATPTTTIGRVVFAMFGRSEFAAFQQALGKFGQAEETNHRGT